MHLQNNNEQNRLRRGEIEEKYKLRNEKNNIIREEERGKTQQGLFPKEKYEKHMIMKWKTI